MDIFEQLKLKPIRKEPDVWISRLAIYETLDPRPVVIRDIRLTRGVNVIWAKDDPDENGDQTTVTGHSAGKTTLCRLLRYVLGEKTFGTKINTSLIRKTFPEGYVAAEVHIRGRRWAVRRPIGRHINSYVKADATIEDVLSDRSCPASLDTYTEELGLSDYPTEFETSAIVRTGQRIQWDHVLAWCTRDQETRFQEIHEWRATRSESETPTFRFPRVDPLFLMRAALGLFLREELKGEEELANLFRQEEDLNKELEEKKREPAYWVKRLTEELGVAIRTIMGQDVDVSVPLRSGNLMPDLEKLTDHACRKLADDINTLAQKIIPLEEQIWQLGLDIRESRKDRETIEALIALASEGMKEIDSSISQRQDARDLIARWQNATCKPGDILVADCPVVQQRLSVLRKREMLDIHAMEQAEAKRAEERKRLEEQKKELDDAIRSLEEQRQSLTLERDALQGSAILKQDQKVVLERALSDLRQWDNRFNDPQAYDALKATHSRLREVADTKQRLEHQLAQLLQKHDENRQLLTGIFSETVASVLSREYGGEVRLDNRELSFHVMHGPTMSGEAVETLAILLADVSCLVYNAVSKESRLPGCLVHDSPREADLGLRIYRSFLRFVKGLQDHFKSPDECPFQYVITTTTPPPDEMLSAPFLKLQLNAAQSEQLLFGRNLAAATGPEPGAVLFAGER